MTGCRDSPAATSRSTKRCTPRRRETNYRNQSIARLLQSYGRIYMDPAEATDLYTRQCSLNVSARDLAVMGATLADGGVNPITRERVVDAGVCHYALAVMATAGLYETSGDWLYDIGLPGKSGIGGGIVTVSPGKGGLGTFAPPLDKRRQQRQGPARREVPLAAAGHGPVRIDTGRLRPISVVLLTEARRQKDRKMNARKRFACWAVAWLCSWIIVVPCLAQADSTSDRHGDPTADAPNEAKTAFTLSENHWYDLDAPTGIDYELNEIFAPHTAMFKTPLDAPINSLLEWQRQVEEASA